MTNELMPAKVRDKESSIIKQMIFYSVPKPRLLFCVGVCHVWGRCEWSVSPHLTTLSPAGGGRGATTPWDPRGPEVGCKDRRLSMVLRRAGGRWNQWVLWAAKKHDVGQIDKQRN